MTTRRCNGRQTCLYLPHNMACIGDIFTWFFRFQISMLISSPNIWIRASRQRQQRHDVVESSKSQVWKLRCHDTCLTFSKRKKATVVNTRQRLPRIGRYVMVAHFIFICMFARRFTNTGTDTNTLAGGLGRRMFKCLHKCRFVFVW